MSGKQAKQENKKSLKFIFLIMIIIIILLLFLLLGYKYFYPISEKNEEAIISEINNQVTIENERLVLKSNYEENLEKKIIYIFNENILDEVIVFEKYNNIDEYNNRKENYNKRTDIEMIETDDQKLQVYYRRVELRSDEGLSYDEVYNKYMGIIGAYEVINK